MELAAAGDARLFKLGDAHAQDARIGCRGHACAALVTVQRKVGHLPEAFACSEGAQELFVLGDAHLAFDQNAEKIARLAFADERRAGADALPLANLDHLPELRVLERGEEAHRAQRGELVRVAEYFAPRFAQPAAQRFDQVGGEFIAAVVALGGFLLHRAAHDAIERRRHAGAMARRRRRFDLRDLVDHAELVVAAVGKRPGEHLVHHDAERIEVGAMVDEFLADLLG